MSKLYVVPEHEILAAIQDKVSESVYGAVEHLAKRMQELEESAYAAKPVLSHRQAAAYTDMAPKTMLKLISAGEIPTSKQGKTHYIRKADLDTWMLANHPQTRRETLRLAA